MTWYTECDGQECEYHFRLENGKLSSSMRFYEFQISSDSRMAIILNWSMWFVLHMYVGRMF